MASVSAADKEEYEFYHYKAPQEWLDALVPLGTNEHKPFLETAPYLIVIFAQSYGLLPDGRRVKHYYVQESVGIATVILITAIHDAGLVWLTHIPTGWGPPGPPRSRASLPSSGRRRPGRGRDGADDHQEATGGDCDVRVNAPVEPPVRLSPETSC